MEPNNLILIGMPGAGKSTVGVILAKRLGLNFIDTDLLIQARQRQRLQEIIDLRGLNTFREIEEKTLLDLHPEHSVIATGGSVVYGQQGMAALKNVGVLLYLQVPLKTLQARIADMGQRGLVMVQGQTFAQLYEERTPLYETYADLVVPCGDRSAEQVAGVLEQHVRQTWPNLSA